MADTLLADLQAAGILNPNTDLYNLYAKNLNRGPAPLGSTAPTTPATESPSIAPSPAPVPASPPPAPASLSPALPATNAPAPNSALTSLIDDASAFLGTSTSGGISTKQRATIQSAGGNNPSGVEGGLGGGGNDPTASPDQSGAPTLTATSGILNGASTSPGNMAVNAFNGNPNGLAAPNPGLTGLISGQTPTVPGVISDAINFGVGMLPGPIGPIMAAFGPLSQLATNAGLVGEQTNTELSGPIGEGLNMSGPNAPHADASSPTGYSVNGSPYSGVNDGSPNLGLRGPSPTLSDSLRGLDDNGPPPAPPDGPGTGGGGDAGK